MKIISFQISNFCSIKELELEMNDDCLITIVGQNESGKTSLLRAIAWWGGDPTIEVTKDDIFGEKKEILESTRPIVMAIVKLTAEEAEEVAMEFEGEEADIENETEEPFSESNENDAKNYFDTLLIGRYFNGYYGIWRKAPSDKLKGYSINEEQLHKLFENNIPRFIYYDVFKEYIGENVIPWPEVLTRPGWKNIAAILNIDKAEHQEIANYFKSANLKKLKKAETELTAVLTSKIHTFWDGTPKRLLISLNSNRMGVHCVILDEEGNEGEYLDPSQMSDGFRWAFCLNTKLEALSKEESNRPLFLLLDEPNTTLSGDQQKKVLEHFEFFCEKGNFIILATHSPFMVDLNKRIMLMEAKDGISTIRSLGELHGMELLVTLRAALNLKLVDSLFFGRFLLIVEGLTDRGHLQLLAEDWLNEHNVSILETDGTSHLPVKLEELEREGLIQDSIVILDSDSAGIKARKHAKKQLQEKGIYLPIRTIRGEDLEDYYSRADFRKICEGFLKETEVSKLEKVLTSLKGDKIERGRLKKVIKALKYEKKSSSYYFWLVLEN